MYLGYYEFQCFIIVVVLPLFNLLCVISDIQRVPLHLVEIKSIFQTEQ